MYEDFIEHTTSL